MRIALNCRIDTQSCLLTLTCRLACAVVYRHEELYFQKLIPGQNQNAEHSYIAQNLGTSHRYCIISGKTLVNGVATAVSAQSNTVDVKVVPQQG